MSSSLKKNETEKQEREEEIRSTIEKANTCKNYIFHRHLYLSINIFSMFNLIYQFLTNLLSTL